MLGLAQRPTLAVFVFNKLLGVFVVFRAHLRAIPIELLAYTDIHRHAAEQDDFGQIGGNVEIRVSRCSSADHPEPLRLLALVRAAVAIVSSNGDWNRLASFVIFSWDKLRLAL